MTPLTSRVQLAAIPASAASRGSTLASSAATHEMPPQSTSPRLPQPLGQPAASPRPEDALRDYRQTRRWSETLCETLEVEDCVVQSMPDASPTRWHLAHTTWFFETFVLRHVVPNYDSPFAQYEYLFNSYYNAVGQQYPRSQRGLLSRPTLAEVWRYRRWIDEQIEASLGNPIDDSLWQQLAPIVQIGIQHEQQHQELMLTDIKHLFSCNPLLPAYRDPPLQGRDVAQVDPRSSISVPEGIVSIGHQGRGFAYDNELPRHRALVPGFSLAVNPVTNRQYLEFIDDGGYRRSEFWLSVGWATVQSQGWQAPLYWIDRDGAWLEFTLCGLRPLVLDAPVCHVSYFEADAYARWAGKRLPTEFEWETVAAEFWSEPRAHGTYAEDQLWHPQPTSSATNSAPHDGAAMSRVVPRQMFGDVWQWTSSPYVGYPGYRPPCGAIGEYNGKFMCNQFVLRGASTATRWNHVRPTYRNFFPPEARWQFSGIRLAE